MEGRLQNWSWVEGDLNPADWATKPRLASELHKEGFWQKGPSFLTEDYQKWPIKHDFKTEKLEGEILPKSVHCVLLASEELSYTFDWLLRKSSDVVKLFRVVARIFRLIEDTKNKAPKTDRGILTAHDVARAKVFWIRFAQAKERGELIKSTSDTNSEKVHGRYKRLAVFEDEIGIWRVGMRMREYTPFTSDGKAPAFIPRNSRLATLLMTQAHNKKHSGIEETVAQFRLSGYWTTEAAKLARNIKSNCVTCRILDKKPII